MKNAAGEGFFACPDAVRASGCPEQVQTLLEGGGPVRVERIVSFGHVTPEGQWYDQNEDEWCLVLEGEGRIAFEDGRDIRLGRGASCFLPRHLRHRVAATSSPCVWLCLFGEGLALNCASCPGLVPLPAGLAEAGAAEDLGTLAEQTELC
ncbi:MAG: cupin domain-containing protein [Desulfovibrio sp.]|jgi:cupin 2 domain-containing protein|nr:cupin domain-containing protein [Desulfovibrio sp.]MBQ1420479.1 cupin domain-containing protein [Desulfovibrio sp.]MCR5169668.1 cupin domain-containing protein [Desulfovibrio sp.]